MPQFKNWDVNVMTSFSLSDFDSGSVVQRTPFYNVVTNSTVEARDFTVSPRHDKKENLKRIRFLQRKRLRAGIPEAARVRWEFFLEKQVERYFHLHPQTLQQGLKEGRICPLGWKSFKHVNVFTPAKHGEYRNWRYFDSKWNAECKDVVVHKDCAYIIPGKGKMVFVNGPASNMAVDERDRIPCPFKGRTILKISDDCRLCLMEVTPPNFEETM